MSLRQRQSPWRLVRAIVARVLPSCYLLVAWSSRADGGIEPSLQVSSTMERSNQTLSRLRQLIQRRDFDAGRMPPERVLAGELGVGRRSLRRALDVLEQEGRISRHQGRGTFVNHGLNGEAAGTGRWLSAGARRGSPACWLGAIQGRDAGGGESGPGEHPRSYQSAGSHRGTPGDRARDGAAGGLPDLPGRDQAAPRCWRPRPAPRPIP